MLQKWLMACCLLVAGQSLFAQPSDLQVQGVAPHLYLQHTVQAKENWYSIGRIYNISPKQLAPFNSLTLDKPLAIGQTLKIPLLPENFSQDGSKAADEVFVPLRHRLQEKEWLYRVSVNYNKVPVETLEKWNNINKDQAKAGLNLVVGYLKVKSGQSVLSDQAATRVARTNPIATDMNEPAKPAVKEDKKPSALPPVPQNVDPTTIRNPPAATESKTVSNTSSVNSNPVISSDAGVGNRNSYFKSQFEESGKSVSGSAGIFKSTSGWNDGKFYALVNNVAVGTIIRVNNPVSGRAVYAKVLGNLPDMKESAGLVARVSDAAAAQLEAAGTRFSVELRY